MNEISNIIIVRWPARRLDGKPIYYNITLLTWIQLATLNKLKVLIFLLLRGRMAQHQQLNKFLYYLGLSESEWMPECQATYNCIQFNNCQPGQIILHYFHPFL